MKKITGCGDTNIPQVDNSELECDPIIKEICVLLESSYPTLGVSAGQSQQAYNSALYNRLLTILQNINSLWDATNDLGNSPFLGEGLLPSYADDEDAGADGLQSGDFYITNGDGTAPLNVQGIVMQKT